MSVSLLAPRRRFVQYLLLALYLLVPFLAIKGNPLLRMDIAGHTLYLAAMPVRIEEFFLVLLLTLVLTVAFLLMTALLGRVWCGWLCPQTVLNDLLELIPEYFTSRKPSPRTGSVLAHSAAFVLASLLSFATLAYFLPPAELWYRLSQPQGYPLLFVTFGLMLALVYLDAVLVKRGFCSSYCPYGRLQTAFMNEGTLNLTFREEARDRCIRCGSCARVCPMGVDIRQGFRIECINCGRCLDACRQIMAKKDGSAGLIAYRFGVTAGGRPRLTGAGGILLALCLLLGMVLVYNIAFRAAAGFSIQRNPFATIRDLPDGARLQPWKGVIENRSQKPGIYRIELLNAADSGISLVGQVRDLRVAPNENRAIAFYLQIPQRLPAGTPITLRLIREGAGEAAKARLTL